ncbi:hypothetical protein CYY_003563 [Polysphondylium violaceum]|uniref:Rap-GAP domain-containing protein n=1 Tax=Polysphondylium violaceum TaxID=133409 RepID=A0A8J4PW59_9MYCE|nr:hypothetical protein CYY_003563 [Polysphondylium violaceum]
MGKIFIYTAAGCPQSKKLKNLFHQKQIQFIEVNVTVYPARRSEMSNRSGGIKTIPQVYFNDKYIGGLEEIYSMDSLNIFSIEVERCLSSPETTIFKAPTLNEKFEVHSMWLFEPDNYIEDIFDKIRDHRYGLKVRDVSSGVFSIYKYGKSFKGSELVSWLMAMFEYTEEESIQIGNILKDNGYIIRVKNNVFPFENSSDVIFKCQQDVDPLVMNMRRLWLGPTRPAPIISQDLILIINTISDKYIIDGKKIDYESLSKSMEFRKYRNLICEIQNVSLSNIDLKSFFINIYNILVIHTSIELKNHQKIPPRRFLMNHFYMIGKFKFSQYDIKHGILRGNKKPSTMFHSRKFKKNDPRRRFTLHLDPRIHFALANGSKSCPSINVYDYKNIDGSLEKATQAFLESDLSFFKIEKPNLTASGGASIGSGGTISASQSFSNLGSAYRQSNSLGTITYNQNRHHKHHKYSLDDLTGRGEWKVILSPMFKWYRSDFGSTDKEILKWILPFLDHEKRELLTNVIENSTNIVMEYHSYDWDRNGIIPNEVFYEHNTSDDDECDEADYAEKYGFSDIDINNSIQTLNQKYFTSNTSPLGSPAMSKHNSLELDFDKLYPLGMNNSGGSAKERRGTNEGFSEFMQCLNLDQSFFTPPTSGPGSKNNNNFVSPTSSQTTSTTTSPQLSKSSRLPLSSDLIKGVQGFYIEDGCFTSKRSFYIDENPNRLLDQGDSLINSFIYRDYFYNKLHSNYLGNIENVGPVCVSVKKEVEATKMLSKTSSQFNFTESVLSSPMYNEDLTSTQLRYRFFVQTPERQYHFCLKGSSKKEIFNSLKYILPTSSYINLKSLTRIKKSSNSSGLSPSLPMKKVIGSSNNLTHEEEEYKAAYYESLGNRLEKELLNFEIKKTIHKFKIGVLYCRPGQNEAQMLSNTHESTINEFKNFLHILGEEVTLRGFSSYNGDLDVQYDNNGNKSIFTHFLGNEIMFHVSTMLPTSTIDTQQTEKKRFLGNDIIVIVYREPLSVYNDTKLQQQLNGWGQAIANGCYSSGSSGGGNSNYGSTMDELSATSLQDDFPPFDPSTIKSYYNHIYIVVEPIIEDLQPIRYKVSLTTKNSVHSYPPYLPSPSIFSDLELLREFILQKCVNGIISSYKSPSFRSKVVGSRKVFFDKLVSTFVTNSAIYNAGVGSAY